jgi:hypothetical protein
MAQYLSPGVYVEETPSTRKPIAGVGTSTAGFIGMFNDSVTVPKSSRLVRDVAIGVGDGSTSSYTLEGQARLQTGHFVVRVDGVPVTGVTLTEGSEAGSTTLAFTAGDGDSAGTGAPAAGAVISGDFVYDYEASELSPLSAGELKLCTNFNEFTNAFGDFSTDPGQRNLAHAVYGFFNNGGTRCYVARVTAVSDVPKALERMAAIDEIALVAAPGLGDSTDSPHTDLVAHCVNTTDRFAILDCEETLDSGSGPDLTLLNRSNKNNKLPGYSDFAAFYFPWIRVLDPATKIQNPLADGLIHVPPSGHMAGIYARVDNARGVHKAPANEVVQGARGLKYQISKAQQDGLNPQGVNCIRELNGNILVWGARTIGGNANADLKYINVRRTLLFLRESIDEGTQWVVFEPNEPGLWKRITRNINAFLTVVWRAGALFGTTQQEAFYVKCDAEINPPEERERGRVITEIGVSIVRPAEFVIFRIGQFTAPGK